MSLFLQFSAYFWVKKGERLLPELGIQQSSLPDPTYLLSSDDDLQDILIEIPYLLCKMIFFGVFEGNCSF